MTYAHSLSDMLPPDWQLKPVSDIASITTGPFGTLLKASEYVKSDGVPVVSVGEIREGFIEATINTPQVPDIVTRRLPQYVLKYGDIVFGRKGGVDRSAMVEKHQHGWFLGSDGISLRPSASCDPRYLAYQFRTQRVQRWLLANAVGTTMPSLNQVILRRVSIPVPSKIKEQQAIAEALSDVDALIDALDKLIAKKRALKQATMQQLLTGKLRLPGFRKPWGVKRLDDIVRLRKDRLDPRRTRLREFCIELEHIEQGTGRLLGSSTTDEASSLKSVFQPEDVLFGKLRPYLQKFWFATQEGVCSTELWVLSAQKSEVLPQFLLQIVMTARFVETASSSFGTHMPRSDWNIVKNYEVHLPSVEEQSAIAAILVEMDAEIDKLWERLAKTRLLKQGMMQELLTGRIRLV